jgi:hypothetical protein
VQFEATFKRVAVIGLGDRGEPMVEASVAGDG